MKRSIRAKLFLAQLGLTLSGVLVLGLVVYWVTGLSLQASQRDLLDHVAQYAGESFDTFITHKQSMLEQIARGDPIEQYAETPREEAIEAYFCQFKDVFSGLSFFQAQGRHIIHPNQDSAAETNITKTDLRLYHKALAKPNETVFSLPETHGDSNRDFATFAYCRKSGPNDIPGLVVGRVPMSDIVRHAYKFKFHQVGYAAVLDDHGHVIAHPDRDLIGKKMLTDIPALVTPHFQGVSQLSRHTRATIMGQDSFVVYRLVPRRKWTTLAVLPYDKYMAPLYVTRDSIILIVLALIAVTFVISSMLAGNMTRPIQTLVTATRDIADGRFKQQVTVTSQDELGQLARSFNDMARRLQATMTSVDKLNHEIHQRESAEKRQTDLMEQIEATNTELKNFAYIVSHDLKAPLRGIKTIADWIQADYADKLDDDGREQLLLLTQRVERMKHLIEGVLQYSRVGREGEDIKPVHLNNIVPEIIDSLAVPGHITVSIDKPLPKVYYEPTRLCQIFQNLLSNAVKYMDKPAGEVHIDFTEDNDQWTFSISDNGPGIEEKHYDKIFGIFQTLNTRDEYESTGIGLAVVKKTIELAGGRIWVTSEVGKGSTFSFTIPKHKAGTMTPASASSPPPGSDTECLQSEVVPKSA